MSMGPGLGAEVGDHGGVPMVEAPDLLLLGESLGVLDPAAQLGWLFLAQGMAGCHALRRGLPQPGRSPHHETDSSKSKPRNQAASCA
eukprot:CAMPEP_0204343130 /NCGR_PEP_ID=MMETSP0469-20131031/24676_1 /ASSEMBLY_ACC=CAM_ASM_000384 /TAXON_ID=2969 /ORGANISM="Oxyrrhis marina" /LENGTH=86 /DNA_ID=CAMNT_0051328179 /DNA_START=316 /DNA_END=577 /DNA_ORIENTATION=+